MTASSDGATVGVSNQLASLVPTFNPASDDLTMYRQKVELVLAAWPKGRITELVTRLIFNCEGTAFQKLQLNHDKLLENDEVGPYPRGTPRGSMGEARIGKTIRRSRSGSVSNRTTW